MLLSLSPMFRLIIMIEAAGRCVGGGLETEECAWVISRSIGGLEVEKRGRGEG